LKGAHDDAGYFEPGSAQVAQSHAVLSTRLSPAKIPGPASRAFNAGINVHLNDIRIN